MDAPLYSPATAYVQPQRLPTKFNAHETALSDLMANPAAWAIVIKVAPGAAGVLKSDAMRPHLGNFTLQSLTDFGLLTQDGVERADAQLRLLGGDK
ncbi:MAG TPA: hypothetical protein VF489_01270 [Sphingobium sp.]